MTLTLLRTKNHTSKAIHHEQQSFQTITHRTATSCIAQ
jgi:hypothetical protein